jgi:predicted RNA-binding protein with RPS1 domain
MGKVVRYAIVAVVMQRTTFLTRFPNTRRLEDGQAYVSLHEFGDVEAMLQFSEVSHRRIKSIRDHLKEGKLYVFQVIKVDTERNYIDLSKRHVTKDETENHTAFFNKSKQVLSVLRLVFLQSMAASCVVGTRYRPLSSGAYSYASPLHLRTYRLAPVQSTRAGT